MKNMGHNNVTLIRINTRYATLNHPKTIVLLETVYELINITW